MQIQNGIKMFKEINYIVRRTTPTSQTLAYTVLENVENSLKTYPQAKKALKKVVKKLYETETGTKIFTLDKIDLQKTISDIFELAAQKNKKSLKLLGKLADYANSLDFREMISKNLTSALKETNSKNAQRLNKVLDCKNPEKIPLPTDSLIQFLEQK